MLDAPEPETEDDDKVDGAERMLDAPVGRRRARDPADALQRRHLDAVETLADDVGHRRRPLHLVARQRHGRGHLVRVVIAQRLLHAPQVDLEPGARVAEHGHGVEDERVGAVRGARRQCHRHRLGLAQVQRPLPRLERPTQLVLRHHVLERLGATLVVPHLEEQGVHHDARGQGTVPRRLTLEQLVVRLAKPDHGRVRDLGLPRLVVAEPEAPERLGRRQLERVDLVEADRRRVVVGHRQQAKVDVRGEVGPSTSLVLDPLGVGRLSTLASLASEFQLVPVSVDHLTLHARVSAGGGFDKHRCATGVEAREGGERGRFLCRRNGGARITRLTLARRPLIEQAHSRPLGSPLQLAKIMFKSELRIVQSGHFRELKFSLFWRNWLTSTLEPMCST